MIASSRSGWTRVRFGEVVSNLNEYYDPERDGVLPYVAGPHIDESVAAVSRFGRTDDDDFPPTFKRMFEPGDVLVHSRNIEKAAEVRVTGVTGEKLFVLRTCDPDVLYQPYLIWLLRAGEMRRVLRENFTGSVNKFVNWTPLAAAEIALPPVSVQRRFAALMWSTELEVQAVSKTVTKTHAARDAFVRGQLDSHPEWPVTELRSVLAKPVRNGISAQACSDLSAVPTISISSVRRGNIAIADNLKFIDVDRDKASGFELRIGDFLVVRGNGNKGLVGLGGLVRETPPLGCVYPDLLMRLSPDEDKLLAGFLPVIWNEQRTHALLLRKAKSTNGIWKVNGKDVSTHLLRLPPLADQQSILKQVASFDEVVERMAARKAEARTTQRVLLKEFLG